jgi:hypothetical protein
MNKYKQQAGALPLLHPLSFYLCFSCSIFFLFPFYSLIVIKHNNNIVAKTSSPSSTKVDWSPKDNEKERRSKEDLLPHGFGC